MIPNRSSFSSKESILQTVRPAVCMPETNRLKCLEVKDYLRRIKSGSSWILFFLLKYFRFLSNIYTKKNIFSIFFNFCLVFFLHRIQSREKNIGKVKSHYWNGGSPHPRDPDGLKKVFNVVIYVI